jgi:hypothetical protein
VLSVTADRYWTPGWIVSLSTIVTVDRLLPIVAFTGLKSSTKRTSSCCSVEFHSGFVSPWICTTKFFGELSPELQVSGPPDDTTT